MRLRYALPVMPEKVIDRLPHLHNLSNQSRTAKTRLTSDLAR